ncbi:hypothetical protein C8J57DRAFT_1466583 [Mycena rebaudengoi]|nr:hypothetical protein C8J57DRAFT_1466583 [Mycena rebaudengoi]
MAVSFLPPPLRPRVQLQFLRPVQLQFTRRPTPALRQHPRQPGARTTFSNTSRGAGTNERNRALGLVALAALSQPVVGPQGLHSSARVACPGALMSTWRRGTDAAHPPRPTRSSATPFPLTSTSLPLSHDAARGRVSPLARAHPPPSPAARAAPDAAARMRGEVVSSSPCGYAAHPRTTETPSRTSDLTASTESGKDAGCAMHTRWRRPGVSGWVNVAHAYGRGMGVTGCEGSACAPNCAVDVGSFFLDRSPWLLAKYDVRNCFVARTYPHRFIRHALHRRHHHYCSFPSRSGLMPRLFARVPTLSGASWVGDADGGSRALRNDCKWVPHITTTTPIFRDAATLHRPRIFALRNEEREIPFRPAHLYIYRTARNDAHRSLPSRCAGRAGFRQQTWHGLPRGSFIWSSAIRRGAIELLVAGERRCSPGALREKR